MKTKVIAVTVILALMVAGIASAAYAHSNGANVVQHDDKDKRVVASAFKFKHTDRDESEHEEDHDGKHHVNHRLNLNIGDTITLSDLQGRYKQVGNSSIRGNASGSFTFTVTGSFKNGYTLSITSGSITIGNSTYTVNNGSAQIPGHARQMIGQGTAGNGVAFLIHAVIRGEPSSAHGMVMLDLKNESAEYLVFLRSTSS
jgi:hypothetical protein